MPANSSTRIADLKLHWFGQASMNIASDPEILRLCQKSGCVGLFIGFETLSPETLAAVGKRVNRPDEYFDVVQRIHDHGIGIDGSFVFGFDTDDEGVFDRTLEFVIKAKLEVAYFSILTPYPGTRLHQRLEEEGRLLTQDWSIYDANHVVYRPKTFTPDQLLEGYHRALEAGLQRPGHFPAAVGNHRLEEFLLPDELRIPPERNESGERRRPAGTARITRMLFPRPISSQAPHRVVDHRGGHCHRAGRRLAAECGRISRGPNRFQTGDTL